MLNIIEKRRDGKFEQQFGHKWVAEYYEDAQNGLWHVEIFRDNAIEWNTMGIPSLREAQQAAQDYITQHTA